MMNKLGVKRKISSFIPKKKKIELRALLEISLFTQDIKVELNNRLGLVVENS